MQLDRHEHGSRTPIEGDASGPRPRGCRPGPLLTIVACILWVCCLFSSVAAAAPTNGMVTAVFDGDTILLESGEKIRYLGVDAPEVSHQGSPADCYGHEAKDLNEQLVFHKRVSLRYDRATTDVHGRWLAYVFLPDGRCVNAELVKKGCATVFHSSEGFGKFDEFLSYQRQAMRDQRGLWGQCRVKPSNHYTGNRRSYVFHRAGCPYGRQTGSSNRTRFDSRNAALEAGYSPCRRCKP